MQLSHRFLLFSVRLRVSCVRKLVIAHSLVPHLLTDLKRTLFKLGLICNAMEEQCQRIGH